jgi:hypothetical protein
MGHPFDGTRYIKCPYGNPGDRLWVRETWRSPQKYLVAYAADGECGAWIDDGSGGQAFIRHGKVMLSPGDDGNFGPSKYGDKWRPSTCMPRWASRITLEITAVRVERLNDISENDAAAEGCGLDIMTPFGHDNGSFIWGPNGFVAAWESLYGAGSWALNSWVWVVEFKRVS